MSLAVLSSRALAGLESLPVRVEIHVGPGLPSFHIVGLPDTGVRESRERVRSAIINSGFEFPSGRVTVNLAPADLPKESGRFDLPIALGVLLASGQVAPPAPRARELRRYVFAGELSLTGAVMPVTAPLAIALGVANAHSPAVLVLPGHGAGLAAHVPALEVRVAASLRQVADDLNGGETLPMAVPCELPPSSNALRCLSEVIGQESARRALEVAASGRHSLLMAGPPGTGKSMLAQCLPSLLPPLDRRQSLELAAVADLCDGVSMLSTDPPFRAPHHSASVAALVGGGVYPRPGEISRAHNGVLFLDELPEFQRAVMESLREPLEHGYIAIARATRSAVFPARFQLLAAMNPCPCGWAGHPKQRCACTPDRIERYRARVSGPFQDRIDLHISLKESTAGATRHGRGETSHVVRQRVAGCLQRQLRRQNVANAWLSVDGLERHCRLDAQSSRLLEEGAQRWGWSLRAVHRIRRVARTIADMAGHDEVAQAHLAEAMQYRQAGITSAHY